VREKVRLGVGGGVIVVEPVRDLLVSLVEYDSDGVGGGEIVADGVGWVNDLDALGSSENDEDFDKDNSSEALRETVGVGGGVMVRVQDRDSVSSSLALAVSEAENEFTDSEMVAVRLKVGLVMLSEPETVLVCVMVSEKVGDLESEWVGVNVTSPVPEYVGLIDMVAVISDEKLAVFPDNETVMDRSSVEVLLRVLLGEPIVVDLVLLMSSEKDLLVERDWVLENVWVRVLEGVGGNDAVLVLEISEERDLEAEVSSVGERDFVEDSDNEKVCVNVGEAVRDSLNDNETVWVKVGVFVGGGLLVRVRESSSEGVMLIEVDKVVDIDIDRELDVVIVIDRDRDWDSVFEMETDLLSVIVWLKDEDNVIDGVSDVDMDSSSVGDRLKDRESVVDLDRERLEDSLNVFVLVWLIVALREAVVLIE
jgi:hypothetical protein